MSDYDRFKDLTFADFRRLARDQSLSRYEKIGFPDSYRDGFEAAIFADIRAKLPALDGEGRTVVDIGPGCSELPSMLIEHCRARGHRLFLIDSKEMLDHLPDAEFLTKVDGSFPANELPLAAGEADVVLTYSVFHYVFAEGNVFDFLDRSLELLAEGGQMLIGDIPNFSKRKRFFASAAGVRAHREFTGSDAPMEVEFNTLDCGAIDDAVIFSLLQRARTAGFDAYVVPQDPGLPMANRREDLLLTRP